MTLVTNNENTLHFIGLMKKAGAIAIGAELGYDAARTGKARLLLIASDAAKNTVDGARNAQGERDCPLKKLPFTKQELGMALGQKECAALAVCDTGFARALCQKLGYSEEEEVLTRRQSREGPKKQKKNGVSKATVNRGKTTHGNKI